MRNVLVMTAIVFGLALSACGSDGDYQGGGRGVPTTGGSADPSADDLGGEEVPPDPAFDDDTEDPPADPGE